MQVQVADIPMHSRSIRLRQITFHTYLDFETNFLGLFERFLAWRLREQVWAYAFSVVCGIRSTEWRFYSASKTVRIGGVV